MNAFETMAIMEDASHLTLKEPAPSSFRGACRVIVIPEREKEQGAGRWPLGFFEDIRISDPGFGRPEQGLTPPVSTLDS